MSDYNVLADTVFLSDTTYKNSVKLIDEHLVISDSVFVTEKTVITKEKPKDFTGYYFQFLALLLIVISFVNHYLKKKKNGS